MLKLKCFYFLFSPLCCDPEAMKSWFDDEAFKDPEVLECCTEDLKDETPNEGDDEESLTYFAPMEIMAVILAIIAIPSLVIYAAKHNIPITVCF